MIDSTVGVGQFATGGSCESGRECRKRGAFFGLYRKVVDDVGTSGSGRAVSRLLRGVIGDGGARECWAAGGGDSAGAGVGAASVVAAFRGTVGVVWYQSSERV